MKRVRFIHGNWKIRGKINLNGDFNLATINMKTGKVAKIRIPIKFIEDEFYDLGKTMEDVIGQFGLQKHEGLIDQEYYTFPY